ncbi:hypothetical protein [Reyranella sp. CPCC 100927]|uniref:hypothetical protein n=1 Tax=Reyranella sp. CPCC 100927 TaxID=2599616 RepID=UPI0011B6E38C|nr:hypothetical protein [Reyranella sp. CPCC 100927]TWT05796.1 hypothetical protein FQU96_25170 [Reyranella sp. CPCC 100927]
MTHFVLVSARRKATPARPSSAAPGPVAQSGRNCPQNVAERVHAFAAFLRKKELVSNDITVSRRPGVELRFSRLTDEGQRFAHHAFHNWMLAFDRTNAHARIDTSALDRCWSDFTRSLQPLRPRARLSDYRDSDRADTRLFLVIQTEEPVAAWCPASEAPSALPPAP